jgi:hypothetical protein
MGLENRDWGMTTLNRISRYRDTNRRALGVAGKIQGAGWATPSFSAHGASASRMPG